MQLPNRATSQQQSLQALSTACSASLVAVIIIDASCLIESCMSRHRGDNDDGDWAEADAGCGDEEDGGCVYGSGGCGTGGSGSGATGARWSTDEDRLLREAVDALGAKQWQRVTDEFLPKRPASQCMHRWNKVSDDLMSAMQHMLWMSAVASWYKK